MTSSRLIYTTTTTTTTTLHGFTCMIPRFANPYLLGQETEIVSRAAIGALDDDDDDLPEHEVDKQCLAVLERIVKRFLGDIDGSEFADVEGRKKKRKIHSDHVDDSGSSEVAIPFRLFSSSTSLISLKPKPPPELKAVERPYEDNDVEAAVRAERAAAVAVEASKIVEESRVRGYPIPNAKKDLHVMVESHSNHTFLVIELPKTRQPPCQDNLPFSKLPERALPNPHDFPPEKMCCPVLEANPRGLPKEKKRARRRRRVRAEEPVHPPSFWRPLQEMGGKSRGYALGPVSSAISQCVLCTSLHTHCIQGRALPSEAAGTSLHLVESTRLRNAVERRVLRQSRALRAGVFIAMSVIRTGMDAAWPISSNPSLSYDLRNFHGDVEILPAATALFLLVDRRGHVVLRTCTTYEIVVYHISLGGQQIRLCSDLQASRDPIQGMHGASYAVRAASGCARTILTQLLVDLKVYPFQIPSSLPRTLASFCVVFTQNPPQAIPARANPMQSDPHRDLPQESSQQGGGKLGNTGCHCKNPKMGRNLVVCIDGTSNRFSKDLKLTNVIRIYDLIEKDGTQLTYYNSGIGTYVKRSKSKLSWTNTTQFLYHASNQAIAWNFEPIILDAYRWLADHYEDGDCIFLFGFSRGAYQVRVLSAMIQRVGLIHKGNTKQIPYAYELYSGLNNAREEAAKNESKSEDGKSVSDAENRLKSYNFLNREDSGLVIKSETNVSSQSSTVEKSQTSKLEEPAKESHLSAVEEAEKAEEVFKRAFCREVNVHFVGAWDTVSSIGFVRGQSHPDATTGMKHPEYAHGGIALDHDDKELGDDPHPHTKEVWFPGSHSDVGGNTSADKYPPSLAWMSMEAAQAGLRMSKPKDKDKIESYRPTRSLRGLWWALEYSFVKRLLYGREGETTFKPNRGNGRHVLEGQKIHKSVFDISGYTPRANLYGGDELKKIEPNDRRIEPWGPFEDVMKYKLTTDAEQRRILLQTMRELSRTELGRQALICAGAFYALRNLPKSESDNVALADLKLVRDIFDEVYEGHLPEKLHYKEVQPLLSHALSGDGSDQSFKDAHKFLSDYTNLTPSTIHVFHQHHHPSPVVFAGFLPGSSERVIAASEDGRIRIWNIKTGQKVTGFKQKEHIQFFLCSPDGRYAVSTSKGGQMYIWDIGRRRELTPSVSYPPASSLASVNVSDQDELAVTAVEVSGSASRVLVWSGHIDHDGGEVVHNDLWEDSTLGAGEIFHPSNNHVDLHSTYHRLSDTNFFEDLKTLNPEGITSIAVHKDSNRDDYLVACGRKNGSITIHHKDYASTQFVPAEIAAAESPIRALAFSPNGKHLIAGGDDNRIRVWDTDKWHQMIAFSEHDGKINGVAISEVDHRIVSCSDDGTVRVWDATALLDGPHLHGAFLSYSSQTTFTNTVFLSASDSTTDGGPSTSSPFAQV
ncbi:hypothetical protein NM688_g5418 [Phlebia brevispora]|uniref:Uncharacterized protein n=1 Tax=Phlebia brevispora TaxID=194682 RepID=A0ACC1SVH7_9APHY|nr:hypothetical protein NM688_g5418 [Phlebia brevispora]